MGGGGGSWGPGVLHQLAQGHGGTPSEGPLRETEVGHRHRFRVTAGHLGPLLIQSVEEVLGGRRREIQTRVSSLLPGV